ncbi:MAG: lactonase family protein [Chloroflexi bacterium]|nr:lactonase family protein [Chloroflexota bacterium]
MLAFVGCYTTPDRHGHGRGISIFQANPANGALTPVDVCEEVPNPSFLALAPDQRTLYAVSGGDSFSHISALAIEPATGRLRLLNRQSSGGSNPVHLSLDATGRYLAVANYGAGSVGLLRIAEDGQLGKLIEVYPQRGATGPHPREQTMSHPHHCPFDVAGQSLAVPDKGLDRIFVYRLDAGAGRLLPAEVPSVASAPGAAPRHIAFDPTNRRAYAINELDSTVTAFDWDAAKGGLTPRATRSSLPPAVTTPNTGAEIAVARSGRFVYASNRGHDSIAVFGVSAADGALAPVEWQPTGGRTPRTFALSPDGRYLYAANQDSDSIVTLVVDQASGRLRPTDQTIQTGSPVCIVFAEFAPAC